MGKSGTNEYKNKTRAVCKTCMPCIWAVSCSGSHCVNTVFVTVTLTFDLVTWKSIGVICESWSIYLLSFMILGISVLELSSGNHSVDGPTDRRTDMCKTIYPLFFEGGHKYLGLTGPTSYSDSPTWFITHVCYYHTCYDSFLLPWEATWNTLVTTLGNGSGMQLVYNVNIIACSLTNLIRV